MSYLSIKWPNLNIRSDILIAMQDKMFITCNITIIDTKRDRQKTQVNYAVCQNDVLWVKCQDVS